MNILFVLENYLPHIGGVEILFKNLCEGLIKLGHEVSIVTHKLKNTKKFEIINGVKIYRVNCFYSRYWFTFLSIPLIFKLSKKVNLIHTTIFNSVFPSWIVAKILKKPKILTVHEVWVSKWEKLTEMSWINAKLHSILERMIYLLNFDKYITISDSTTKQLINIGKDKSKIFKIYPGINYQHWNPKKYNGNKIRKKLKLKNNFIYLFSGRPGTSKGLEYLIKAAPLISKKIPSSKLLAIVSKDPSYKKQYQKILKLIKKLKLKNKIILHAPVSYSELPNYIKAANCVVIPSLAEGFGFAAIEACTMKKPVIASNTASLPEVISGKFVLVQPKNPPAIANGIEKVYRKKTTNTPLKKFKVEDNINNYLKIYKEMIK